jgi:glycosyltransferase involved in cell wall biosynthesis
LRTSSTQGEADVHRQRPEVTVVVPVYRNARTLPELCRRLHTALAPGAASYELLFVDDACPEGSLAVLEKLARGDSSISVVALQRNTGQQRAVLAGLRLARGRVVVVMDADLQDPPEAVPLLLDGLRHGFAAVFAGRRGSYESAPRLVTSRLFKRALHLLCGVPADAGIFVAMNRQLVRMLVSFHAPRPYLVGMIGCTGLPVSSVPVERAPRADGPSAYTSWMRFKTGLLALMWVMIWRLGTRRLGRGPRAAAGSVSTEVRIQRSDGRL